MSTLNQIDCYQPQAGTDPCAVDLLTVIADKGYLELDFMRDTPDQRSVRDRIARAAFHELTVSRSWKAADVQQALMDLRDWTSAQTWHHATEIAGQPRYRSGRVKLARWLAAWPFQLRRSLDSRRPLRDARDLARLVPPFVPGKMPNDEVLVQESKVVLIEMMHLTRNSEIWLCEARGIPGQFVIKFGLTRESRACLNQEIAILRRLAPLKIPGILMPLWDLSILSGLERALTFPYHAHGSLAGLLEREGSFAIRDVNEVILPQLLRTFARLHRLTPSVVHADIKPHNILVEGYRNGRLTLVVNDLGASAVQPDAPAAGEPEPAPMARAATPTYASLEQLSGWLPSISDDIYALNVLWCRLLGIDPIDETRLPPGSSPIHWKERLRPGLQEKLKDAGLADDQVRVILAGLGPNFHRPTCEEMARVLGVEFAS